MRKEPLFYTTQSQPTGTEFYSITELIYFKEVTTVLIQHLDNTFQFAPSHLYYISMARKPSAIYWNRLMTWFFAEKQNTVV